jgi:hypothetical protein
MKGERSYQFRDSKLQGEADPYVKAMEARDQRIRDLEHQLKSLERRAQTARRLLSTEAEDRKAR